MTTPPPPSVRARAASGRLCTSSHSLLNTTSPAVPLAQRLRKREHHTHTRAASAVGTERTHDSNAPAPALGPMTPPNGGWVDKRARGLCSSFLGCLSPFVDWESLFFIVARVACFKGDSPAGDVCCAWSVFFPSFVLLAIDSRHVLPAETLAMLSEDAFDYVPVRGLQAAAKKLLGIWDGLRGVDVRFSFSFRSPTVFEFLIYASSTFQLNRLACLRAASRSSSASA